MKIFSIVLFTFLSNYTFCQDYSDYYTSCNLSDSLVYVNQKEEALVELKRAFETVDFVHTNKCSNAYRLAIELHKYDEAFLFGKMMIIHSGEKDRIKTKSKEFKKSKYYRQLADSLDHYLELFNQRVNHSYIRAIDSLHYIDQRIIRGNREGPNTYKLKKRDLRLISPDLDASNWHKLEQLIDQYGFPSEKNVGAKAYQQAAIILHHNLRLKENEYYHKHLYALIRSGQYTPDQFHFWYEQYYNQYFQKPYFYVWISDLSEQELAEINANRKRYFLKSLNAFEIKNIGIINRMIPVW